MSDAVIFADPWFDKLTTNGLLFAACACRGAHHGRIAPIGLSVSKARTVRAVSEAVTFADPWFDKLTTNGLLFAACAC